MDKTKRVVLVLATLMLAGCLNPEPREIDFGKIYVGQHSEAKAVRWINFHQKEIANLSGVHTQPPFELLNSAASFQLIRPTSRSIDYWVRFSPVATGKFDAQIQPDVKAVQGNPVLLHGQGVWRIQEGALTLENKRSKTGDESVIHADQPIDFQTIKIGDHPKTLHFIVRNNSPVANVDVSAKALNGDRGFSVSLPNASDNFPVKTIDGPTGPATGAQEVHVTFTPANVGEFMDVVEIVDPGNSRNRAGVVVKVKVLPSN